MVKTQAFYTNLQTNYRQQTNKAYLNFELAYKIKHKRTQVNHIFSKTFSK